MRLFSIIWILIFSLYSPLLEAQQTGTVDLLPSQAEYLETLYNSSAGAGRRFINGSEYRDSYIRASGHPFFLTTNWVKGMLIMHGRSYDQLSVKYDIYRDQLLYNHILESGAHPLVLNKTRIDSFTIRGHRFCHLRRIPGTDDRTDAGYYEILSQGKARLYIKWRKRYNEPTVHSRGEFIQTIDRYILNEGSFFRINRRWGLLRALGDRKKEIRTYIRRNRLLVGPGHEEELKEIVEYYNAL
ncbi:MAG: hypothetical protein R6U78_06440 [Bacteroidales bacterium]